MMKQTRTALALITLLSFTTPALADTSGRKVAPDTEESCSTKEARTGSCERPKSKAKGPYFSIIEHQEDQIRRQIEFNRLKKREQETLNKSKAQ